MTAKPGVLVVSEDTILQGKVDNCRQLEIFGYIDGEVAAETLIVHPGGRCFGTVRAGSADIHGTLQGTIGVTQLIHIRATGEVSGSVRYGQMAMDPGGSLSAEVRNIPPSLAGDFEISVERGGAVRLTAEDLHAVDPDDDARTLTFSVTNAKAGFIASIDAAGRTLTRFTQADLDEGKIIFRHDGSQGADAGFDVVVADHTGATSGAPQSVHVAVR